MATSEEFARAHGLTGKEIDPALKSHIEHQRASSPHAPLAQKGNLAPHFETQETIKREPAPHQPVVDEWGPSHPDHPDFVKPAEEPPVEKS